MVEVRHDDDEAVVFLTEEVVHGDFDVIKLDKSCGCGGGVAGLDLFGFDIVVAGDEDYREAFLGL